jgi:predicted SAM-dependent methyltransferase
MIDAVKKIYRIINPTDDKRFFVRQKRVTPSLITNYLNSPVAKKLHIGCQDHPIEGWLNVDLEPKHKEVAFMDATRKFPFEDNSFDFIFSEHMIEHISGEEGLFMICECYRTLKPGGALRISTPDLNFLIELFQHDKTNVQKEYIEFAKKFLPPSDFYTEAMIINNFFRAWGHQFIYDEKTMKFFFEKAGFKNIQFPGVGVSDYEITRNIEQHGFEIGHDFNRLESFVTEGVK